MSAAFGPGGRLAFMEAGGLLGAISIVAEVLGHMEPVERDLHHGIRDHRQGGRDVGPPHVHADALDGRTVLLPQALVERHQHILAPPPGAT